MQSRSVAFLCLSSLLSAIASSRQTLIRKSSLVFAFSSPIPVPFHRVSSSFSCPSFTSFLPMGKCSSPVHHESPNRFSSGPDFAPGTIPSDSCSNQVSCASSDSVSGTTGAVDSLPSRAVDEKPTSSGYPTEPTSSGYPTEPTDVKRCQTGGTWYHITDTCKLALHRGDITKWKVDGKTDAIVNAANQGLLGGGGVDGAIHRAAGPELYKACRDMPLVANYIRCKTGDAVITSAFRLPVSKIIHAVGPIYEDNKTSSPLLENAYKNSISIAVRNNVNYLCFSALSCGVYGYPHHEAAEIALKTIRDNAHGLKEIHFVLFEESSWLNWLSKADEYLKKDLQDH